MYTHVPVVCRDWPELPRRLTREEAACVARVSGRTIRRWIIAGLIRANKPAGGRVLVDRDSLRAFIEAA